MTFATKSRKVEETALKLAFEGRVLTRTLDLQGQVNAGMAWDLTRQEKVLGRLVADLTAYELKTVPKRV